MIYILLNLGAITAATLAGLIIGVAFLRLGSVRARPGVRLLLVAIVMEFWLASILAGALILAPPKGSEWTMAIGSAFVIWIGFVLPVLAVAPDVPEDRSDRIAIRPEREAEAQHSKRVEGVSRRRFEGNAPFVRLPVAVAIGLAPFRRYFGGAHIVPIAQ